MFQFTSFPSLRLFIHLRIPAHYCRWVPPFGYLRISGYLLLPAAFRSLSRPSSAPSAKASALCSFSLDLLLAIFPLYCVMPPSFISHIPEYAPSSFSRIPCLKKKFLRSFMFSSVASVNNLLRLLLLLLLVKIFSGFSVQIIVLLPLQVFRKTRLVRYFTFTLVNF